MADLHRLRNRGVQVPAPDAELHSIGNLLEQRMAKAKASADGGRSLNEQSGFHKATEQSLQSWARRAP